jgi:hypothetical protein
VPHPRGRGWGTHASTPCYSPVKHENGILINDAPKPRNRIPSGPPVVRRCESGILLVACFSLTAFVNWKGLQKAPGPPDFVVLLFAVVVVAMLTKWLVAFTCFRERLVFGLVIVSMVAAEVERFVPSIVSRHVETVKSGHLALSLLSLLLSLSMLVQSAANPHDVKLSEGETAIANRPKHRSLILLAFIVTVLLLGAMLYFLPLAGGSSTNR